MSRPLLLLLLALAPGCFSIPRPDAAPETFAVLPRERYLAGDLEVEAVRSGDPGAPRIVWIHGSPGSAEAWADFLVDPVPGAESFAPDRPGFGATGGDALRTLADQAAALEPLLVSVDGQAPVLVGHSLGAPVAVAAAVHYPGRVGGLVLVAGPLDPELEERRWYNRVAPLFYWMLPTPLVRSNQELWDLKRELAALAPRLAEVRCPVVVLHGEDDDLVPYGHADFAAGAFPGSARVTRVDLPGADHFVPWVEPHESRLRQVVVELFEGLAADGAP